MMVAIARCLARMLYLLSICAAAGCNVQDTTPVPTQSLAQGGCGKIGETTALQEDLAAARDECVAKHFYAARARPSDADVTAIAQRILQQSGRTPSMTVAA